MSKENLCRAADAEDAQWDRATKRNKLYAASEELLEELISAKNALIKLGANPEHSLIKRIELTINKATK